MLCPCPSRLAADLRLLASSEPIQPHVWRPSPIHGPFIIGHILPAPLFYVQFDTQNTELHYTPANCAAVTLRRPFPSPNHLKSWPLPLGQAERKTGSWSTLGPRSRGRRHAPRGQPEFFPKKTPYLWFFLASTCKPVLSLNARP